jgi:(E)-4-hydroxy-3-methylbut-2-enyl-diphosphate synthase
VGKGDKRDRAVRADDRVRLRYDKPVRIGVNWGSLDQELLAQMMDENAAPRPALGCQAGDVPGADQSRPSSSAARAEELGLAGDRSSSAARSAACRT